MTKPTAGATTSAPVIGRNPESDAERLACFEAWNVSMDMGGGRGIGEFAFLTFSRKMPKFMIWGQVARLCDKPKSTLRDMANKHAYSLTTEKGKKALSRMKQIGALSATTSGTVIIKASQVSGLLSESHAPDKVQEDFKIMRKKARPPPGLRGMPSSGGDFRIAATKSPTLAHGASTSCKIKRVEAATPKLQRQGSLHHAKRLLCEGTTKRSEARGDAEEEEGEAEDEEEGVEEELLQESQLQPPQLERAKGGGSRSEEEVEEDGGNDAGLAAQGVPIMQSGAALSR